MQSLRSTAQTGSGRFAAINAAIVAVVEAIRIGYIAHLSDGPMVNHIPDDAFYYMQAARNFARLGRWTFDTVEPSSGFHLLWGYVLAAIYWLHPSISVHAVFVVGSVIQSACLVLAAYLVTRTAARLAGENTWPGVLLIFLSAASLWVGTAMMESTFVIVCAALLVNLLARTDIEARPMILAGAFLLGIFSTLSRSDTGLLAFWILVAQLYLWRRGISSARIVRVSFAALVGAATGVLGLLLHTHWISGEWTQASAQQKFYWTQLAGRTARTPFHVFQSLFNVFTHAQPLVPGSILGSAHLQSANKLLMYIILLVMLAGLALLARQQPKVEMPAFALVLFFTTASYVVFYRLDSAAVQDWYIANFEVPTALLMGLGLAWFYTRSRIATSGFIAVMCLMGIACSFTPAYPWQEVTWRGGRYFHDHPELGPVGAWNAGIEGYFADNGVVNVDGLMNDSLLPYTKGGRLDVYLAKRPVRYLFDFPYMFDKDNAQKGGYADGTLQRCLVASQDLFPDDPYNVSHDAHIRLYTVDTSCLKQARQTP